MKNNEDFYEFLREYRLFIELLEDYLLIYGLIHVDDLNDIVGSEGKTYFEIDDEEEEEVIDGKEVGKTEDLEDLLNRELDEGWNPEIENRILKRLSKLEDNYITFDIELMLKFKIIQVIKSIGIGNKFLKGISPIYKIEYYVNKELTKLESNKEFNLGRELLTIRTLAKVVDEYLRIQSYLDGSITLPIISEIKEFLMAEEYIDSKDHLTETFKKQMQIESLTDITEEECKYIDDNSINLQEHTLTDYVTTRLKLLDIIDENRIEEIKELYSNAVKIYLENVQFKRKVISPVMGSPSSMETSAMGSPPSMNISSPVQPIAPEQVSPKTPPEQINIAGQIPDKTKQHESVLMGEGATRTPMEEDEGARGAQMEKPEEYATQPDMGTDEMDQATQEKNFPEEYGRGGGIGGSKQNHMLEYKKTLKNKKRRKYSIKKLAMKKMKKMNKSKKYEKKHKYTRKI